MPNETTVDDKNNALEDEDGAAPPADRAEDEFQLTIKKLEMPVRPRGVLAD
jgi:hypothetical protein